MTQIRSIRRLLRRKTHFVSDMYARDMLYGLTVRSDRARGKLLSIELPEHYSHLRLITAADIPGSNSLEVYGDAMPILAFDDVRYIGEPIALLVGPDLSVLNAAIDHIVCNWDESFLEQPRYDFRRPEPEQIALELTHSYGEPPKDLRSAAPKRAKPVAVLAPEGPEGADAGAAPAAVDTPEGANAAAAAADAGSATETKEAETSKLADPTGAATAAAAAAVEPEASAVGAGASAVKAETAGTTSPTASTAAKTKPAASAEAPTADAASAASTEGVATAASATESEPPAGEAAEAEAKPPAGSAETAPETGSEPVPEANAETEAAPESSDGWLYSHHTTGAQEHLYNEPQGAFCVREAKTRIVVYSATQWPFLLRDTVCSVLNISTRNCVVRAADIGTSLDGKLWYPALTAAHAALGCFLTGKPLKIMYSREEDFRYSTKRAPTHIRYATIVDENGEIESMDVTVHLAVGAYGVFTHEILSRTALAAAGHYRRKNLRITARAVRTNLPPANVFSGFGDSAGSFALESHIARVVAATEFVPSSWKAANLLTRGEHDISGVPLDNDIDSGAIIEKVAANSDFNRKHAAFELQKKRRSEHEEMGIRPRGIGIAFASLVDGFLDHGEASALSSTVKLHLDSESKGTIFTSAVAENQTLHQHWIQSVSEILGISDVEIVDIDTDIVPDSGPSTLSRNTAVIGKLIENCANTIKKRRFRDPLPIEARKTVKAAKGKKTEQNWGKALSAHGNATVACVVEVELEPATLATRVRGIWICAEAGRIVDPEQARKALEAGVAQALGWTTGEVIEYVDGAITTEGYEMYKPGRAPTREQLHIEFVHFPGKRSPHGVEGLAGLVVPAAYIAATEQAGAVQLNAVPSGPAAVVGRLEAT